MPHPIQLAQAAARVPFALFWGPTCLMRRTAEGFFWGSAPAPRPRPRPLHVYKITCEPPCHGGCGCGCGSRHG